MCSAQVNFNSYTFTYFTVLKVNFCFKGTRDHGILSVNTEREKIIKNKQCWTSLNTANVCYSYYLLFAINPILCVLFTDYPLFYL